MTSTRLHTPAVLRTPWARTPLAVLLLLAGVTAQGPTVACAKAEDRVRVTIDGKPFTSYVFGGLKRPCLWPVVASTGAEVTRRWPLADPAAGEKKDHPHHTGIWFGHGSVNGLDFWHPQDKKRGGRVSVLEWLEDPAETRRIRVRQQWRGPSGDEVARDVTTLAFGADPHTRWIDWTVEVEASAGPLRFGDTKEGTLGVRMNPALRLEGAVATGTVLTSTGKTGKGVWGKRASWIDYSGTINDAAVGVAIMDHPNNPRYPTWWHARAYGLCAANPFGTRAFEGKNAAQGDFLVAAKKKVTFRWRILVHGADAGSANVEAHHLAWTRAVGGPADPDAKKR